jgi:chromosome segregation ATPase
MSTVVDTVELKSPLRKLVRFFRRSRDSWKAKHHAVKQKCRRLANQAAAVEKSREQWRKEALDLRHRVNQMESELARQKASLPMTPMTV